MPVSPARVAAFEILLRIERESSYAAELLHSATYARLSSRDHALATELVFGVLRWQSRLDEEIAAASSQRLSRLDIEVLTALRLALHQVRSLDRIPKRAALYESVELVKLARKGSAATFVNAVLRKLAATNGGYDLNIPEQTDLSPESLARVFSHPLWIVERWAKEYGMAVAQKICEYDQSIPTTVVRLRTSSAEDELKQEEITLSPAELLSSARIVVTGDITKTRGFRERHVIIQDQASQLVAALIGTSDGGVRSPSRILDCCAAPGGKTLGMADRNANASIVAIELHPHRAKLLKKLMSVAKVRNNVQVVVADAQRLPISSLFDRVLADVPCSGTGTLVRNPEIKWRLQLRDLKDLQTRQVAILQSAMAQTARSGRVLYSTCSLEREENEDVLDYVLSRDHSFRVLDCRTEVRRLNKSRELVFRDVESLTRGPYLRTVPGVHSCDGFFGAILEKS